MQFIFDAGVTPEEYHKLGRNFSFPQMDTCMNPTCGYHNLPIPPDKHGFYERTAIDGDFVNRIMICRYRCRYCGMTFSYLPSFCLPYFQYTIKIVFLSLLCSLSMRWRSGDCLKAITSQYLLLFIYRQHIEFYTKRFMNNLNLIKLGLRQLKLNVKFPYNEDKKEAQKLVDIVTSGFAQIHTFSQRFFAQCKRSFMASR